LYKEFVGKPCSDKLEDQQTQTTPTTSSNKLRQSSTGFDIAPTRSLVARKDYISGKVSIEIDHHLYNGAFRPWSSFGHGVVSFITRNWQQTTTAGTRSNNRMSGPHENQHVACFFEVTIDSKQCRYTYFLMPRIFWDALCALGRYCHEDSPPTFVHAFLLLRDLL
jgi:hypothetical protein